jgi:outer membrane protein assembly factor BamB
MIKIISSIVLLLGSVNLIAQPNYTAFITDPQIGPDANADKLIEVVDDINKRENISLVVVMGNITANGKFDEFLWAQEILDELSVSYIVIGGEKDYFQSEWKGNEIPLLWGDKFSAMTDNMLAIGLNTFHPFYSNMKYLDIETKSWLNKLLETNLQENVLVCSYYSIDEVQNKSDEFSQGISGRHVYFIDNKGLKVKNDEIVNFSSLSKNNLNGYHLINIDEDSIYVSKTEIRDSSFALHFKEKKTTLFYLGFLLENDKEENANNKSSTELKSSTISTVKVDDRLFSATKNGKIFCLDENQKELWNYETNSSIYSSPKVEKDLLVVAANEGDLFTINVNNGNVFQVIGIGETITSEIELVDIEFNGMQTKGICFGTAEGNFYCYELYSLELIWWNNGVKEMINSSIATVKGKVLFQDKKGILYCLSSDNGALLWKWEVKTKIFNALFKSDIIIKDNTIYLIDYDGDLHCIDALLGTKKWSLRKLKASGKIKLNNKKNELILHSGNNKIISVSITTGKVIEEFILPEETKDEIATEIEFINGKLVVGFTNGDVYQLMAKKVPQKIFWQSDAPIVSINEMNGNILVTDYDGNLTLLELSKEKK